MAHRIAERSFPLPPWMRTPFVVVGLATLFLGWRYLDGLLAVQFESQGRLSLTAVFLFVVVAVSTLVGVALVSTGLVIPGASRISGVPELGFSRRRRRLIARGALLSVVGPFVGAVVSVLFSPLPGDSVLSFCEERIPPFTAGVNPTTLSQTTHRHYYRYLSSIGS
ncbi:hypothetical protein [Haladaptatus sp. NG-WS-4]